MRQEMNEASKKQPDTLKSIKIVKWVRTHDKKALEANFDVICPHCGEKMLLRNSECILKRSNDVGRAQVEPLVSMMYKCRPCAWVTWFYVGYPYVDNDYWNEVMKLRDNHPLYVPKNLWSKEAIIQKRLKDTGYWGGDIDYSEKTDLEGDDVD